MATEDKKKAFLEALAKGFSAAAAASVAGASRSTIYRWRHMDCAFAQAWREALEAAADLLEDEARRRAVEGIEEVVYYGGKPVGVVRKYSDSLLTLLLKGHRPDLFRDPSPAEGREAVILSDKERKIRLEALLERVFARHQDRRKTE